MVECKDKGTYTEKVNVLLRNFLLGKWKTTRSEAVFMTQHASYTCLSCVFHVPCCCSSLIMSEVMSEVSKTELKVRWDINRHNTISMSSFDCKWSTSSLYFQFSTRQTLSWLWYNSCFTCVFKKKQNKESIENSLTIFLNHTSSEYKTLEWILWITGKDTWETM